MPLLETGIVAGAGLVGQGLGAISTSQQNRKSRKWSEKMYQRQYDDNIKLWQMQNAYNSPEQQMQRLKTAGLNPNLVYGKGSVSAGMASPLKSPDPKNPQFQSTDFSGVASTAASAVNTYHDTRIKQAQHDNLKSQNTVMLQDALLKAAQTSKTAAESKTAGNIAKYSADAARNAVRQQEASIESITTDTDRKQALHSKNMEQAALNIIRTKVGTDLDRKRIQNIVQDTNLKRQEYELAREGIFKHDPLWMRVLIQNIDSIMEKLKFLH